MNRTGTQECLVCSSDRCTEIDAALATGMPFRHVSQRFGISKSAIARHRTEHTEREASAPAAPALVAQALERARSTAVVSTSGDVLAELNQLKATITAFLEVALTTGKLSLPLVRELRATQELVLKSVLLLEQREPPAPEPVVFTMPPAELEAKTRGLVLKYIACLSPDALAALLASAAAMRDELQASVARDAATSEAAKAAGRLRVQSADESAPVGGRKNQEKAEEPPQAAGMTPEAYHDFQPNW